MVGWCEWASVKVKGASHWPTPLCLDLLLLFTQFVTSALWDQYYRQHVGGRVALTNFFRCPLVPIVHVLSTTPLSCVSER